MKYRVRRTLVEHIRNNIPDGTHTLVLKDGTEINVEVLNLSDVEYTTSPVLGTETDSMLILKYNNLTIGSSVVLTPADPRRGMCIFVKGELINNGTISMTARGVETEGQNIYLYENEFIPAIGAEGGGSVGKSGTNASFTGVPGANGVGRQTGGGASGSSVQSGDGSETRSAYSGTGGRGTSYSGGPGGGAATREWVASNAQGGNGSSSGGAGGFGVFTTGNNASQPAATGGAGNPGGAGSNPRGRDVTQLNGSNGTGGLLILVTNVIRALGTVESKGSNGGIAHTIYGDGGSSGGGSINIFYSELNSTIDLVSAAGGESRTTNNGGDGTVSLDQIPKESFLMESIYVSANNIAEFLERMRISLESSGGVGNVGEIFLWPMEIPPTGSLVCDGSSVSRDLYADLFDIIGETFGAGDGTTTFNLPDLMVGWAIGEPIPCIRYKIIKLPWCSGHFQNRSLAVNTHSIITPVADDGESTMIVGNRFIAPKRGIYILTVPSLRGSSTATQQIYIQKNSEGNGINILGFATNSGATLQSNTISCVLEENDYLAVALYSTVAQTTILAGESQVNIFTFKCLEILQEEI